MKNNLLFYSANALIGVFSLFIIASFFCAMFVDFYDFKITFSNQFFHIRDIFSNEVLFSFQRTLIVALLSMLIVIGLTFQLRKARDRRVLLLLFIIYYLFDPISRSFSLQSSIFLLLTVFEEGPYLPDVVFNILVPSLTLALYFFPLVLLIELFFSKSDLHEEKLLLEKDKEQILDLSRFYSALPLLGSLIFLVSFFEPWVVEMVTFRKTNYFGPMITSRILFTNDITAAIIMALSGFVTTLLVYLFLVYISSRMKTKLLSKRSSDVLPPSKIKSIVVQNGMAFLFILLIFSQVSWMFGIEEGFNYNFFQNSFFSFINSVLQLSCILLISFFLMISLAPLRTMKKYIVRKFSFLAILVVALSPEVIFILISAFLIKYLGFSSGFFMCVVMFASFSTAILYYLFVEYFDSIDFDHRLFCEFSRSSVVSAIIVVVSEHKKFVTGAILIVCFLYLDNYQLITSSAGSMKSLTVDIAGKVSKGFHYGDAFLIIEHFLYRALTVTSVCLLVFVLFKRECNFYK